MAEEDDPGKPDLILYDSLEDYGQSTLRAAGPAGRRMKILQEFLRKVNESQLRIRFPKMREET